MKHYYVIGKSSHDKIWFMCYLGKLMSQLGRVLIISNYPLFSLEEHLIEISSELDLLRCEDSDNIAVNDYEYILHDREYLSRAYSEAGYIFVTSTDREELYFNKNVFEKSSSYVQGECSKYLVICKVVRDSKINERYLMYVLEEFLKLEKVYYFSIPFSEWDYIVQIENDFDEKIRIRHLSKAYKRVLKNILIKEGLVSSKRISRFALTVERG